MSSESIGDEKVEIDLDHGQQHQQDHDQGPMSAFDDPGKMPREKIGTAMRCVHAVAGIAVAWLCAWSLHGPGYVLVRAGSAHVLANIGGFGHRVHGIAAPGSGAGLDLDGVPLSTPSAGVLGQVCCLGGEGGDGWKPVIGGRNSTDILAGGWSDRSSGSWLEDASDPVSQRCIALRG